MTPKDIDALVSIVREAIDQRTASARLELEASLAKAMIRLELQKAEISHLSETIKAIPAPKEVREVTPEMVADAVAKYMASNPINAIEVPQPIAPTMDELMTAVSSYMAANPIDAPKVLAPDQADIAKSVADYMAAHPVAVPSAPDPLAPTAEQIGESVKSYMAANPIKAPEPLSPSADAVFESVTKYMAANPVQVPAAPEPLAPTAEQLDAAVAKHFEGFEVQVPEPSPEMIAKAVSSYMAANPVPVPSAPEALQPTDEQVGRVVAKHLSDNPPQPGARGLDAMEINILPSISPSRRYAKGTYARWGGGVIRALRDTDPGEPMETGCWDVVVEGVKAVEVHPIGGGEFAIKSVLTGGQSSVAKISAPTFQESYRDVWKESAGEYNRGDLVTHKGAVWLAKSKTTERPGTGDAWKLVVKNGRDGKDVSVVKLERPATYKLGA